MLGVGGDVLPYPTRCNRIIWPMMDPADPESFNQALNAQGIRVGKHEAAGRLFSLPCQGSQSAAAYSIDFIDSSLVEQALIPIETLDTTKKLLSISLETIMKQAIIDLLLYSSIIQRC